MGQESLPPTATDKTYEQELAHKTDNLVCYYNTEKLDIYNEELG